MNPFEISIVVGLPTIALLSLVMTAALKSQLSGYSLIAASVFLAWVFCTVLAVFLFDALRTYLGPVAMLVGMMALAVFLVRVVRHALKSRAARQ